MQTILYLSYTGMTDPLGQSQVLAYLKGLQQTGRYRFVLVSFEKAAPYGQLKNFISNLCNEAGIIWHPLPYTATPPVLSTYNDVRAMRRLAQRLVKEHQVTLVHCRSYIPALVGLQLKKRYGLPFLFDMRGFWANERIDGGIWKLSNPLYRAIYSFFKKKEKAFLQTANHTVSLTQNGKTEIGSWKLMPPPAPITVIPCCADFEHFDPDRVTDAQKEAARNALNIPAGARVLSYLGTLGTWYMLPQMMQFAAVYQKRFSDTYFMMLTGEPETMVRDAATAAGFNTALLRIKKVARQEVPAYLSLSTVSLFFIKPSFSKKASSPVKQGELMAMGIPIICNDGVGDTGPIVREAGAGVVVNGFTEKDFENAITEFDVMPFDGIEIRKKAMRYFSLAHGVALYDTVYQQMGA